MVQQIFHQNRSTTLTIDKDDEPLNSPYCRTFSPASFATWPLAVSRTIVINKVCSDQAMEANPFFFTRERSLSVVPAGFFCPRSHWLTDSLLTFR